MNNQKNLVLALCTTLTLGATILPATAYSYTANTACKEKFTRNELSSLETMKLKGFRSSSESKINSMGPKYEYAWATLAGYTSIFEKFEPNENLDASFNGTDLVNGKLIFQAELLQEFSFKKFPEKNGKCNRGILGDFLESNYLATRKL